MYSKPRTFSHPPCPKALFIPVWRRQLGVTRLHRSPGLHSSPSTTSLDTIFTLYGAASSSPSCTAQLRRVHLALHDSKARGFVKGNGRRPGDGGRSDWREEHNRVTKRPWQEEGDLFGDLLVHLTRGEAHYKEARHRAARLEAHHRAARLDGVHRVVQDKGQQDR